MKNYFQKAFLLLVVLIPATLLHAYTFEAINEDGVTIYYNIINSSEKTCAVTYNDNSSYKGRVKIPETVTYSSQEYKVTKIGTETFDGCKLLTSVVIPNTVTTIGEDAFYGCSSLSTVTIPNSIAKIEDSAFSHCEGLQKVIVKDIAAWCKIFFSGELSNPLYYAQHLYSDEYTEITNLIIPNSVSGIPSYAFENCIGLKSITIPNSVKGIGGKNTFYGCSELETVSFSNSITSIGERIFANCTSLKSIVIPNSVKIIGNGSFSGCTSLSSVTIPNSVTSIGNGAFSGCTSLSSATIPNSVTSIGNSAFSSCTNLNSATIPNSVTSIGNSAFYNCTSLSSVTIPNSVTSIGVGAFSNCIILSSVAIPNSVTSISEYAFSGCTRLTSVTIPNSITSIGEYAFIDCNALKQVFSKIEKPFKIDNSCFSNQAKQNATLYVPYEKAEVYQVLGGWNFKTITDGIYHQLTLTANEGGVITFNSTKIENKTITFDVLEGEPITIYVKPNEKYKLTSLKMNGLNVLRYMDGNSFTIDEIDSDVKIVATFDLSNPYITITPSVSLQTFCSEENLNFSEVNGLTAYIVVGYKPSAKELLLTPVIEVPAGTGVLLKGEVGATYKVPTLLNSDYSYNNALVGVLNETEVTTGYVFDELFKAVDGSAVVPTNTAYLLLPAATESGVNELKCYLTDGPSVKGDINGDGHADISDVVALVNLILGS